MLKPRPKNLKKTRPYNIFVASNTTAQMMITRLPYAPTYDPNLILELVKQVDERGLICLVIPIHVEAPNNGGALITRLEEAGLTLVAKIAWRRDRFIVTTKSKRLTNCWEPIAIFSKSKKYILNRVAAMKIKKGYETKESGFDEDEWLTCVGDHWGVPNDRRDRRFIPETIVLNCASLADLQPGDSILDPYGNPGVKDACEHFGWKFIDGDLPSEVRDFKKEKKSSV